MGNAQRYTWGEAFIPGTKRYLREVRAKAAAGKTVDVAQVALRLQWSLKHDRVIIPFAVREIVWELCNDVMTCPGQVRLKPYRRRLAALVSGPNPLLTLVLDPRDFAMTPPDEYGAFMRYSRARFEAATTGA